MSDLSPTISNQLDGLRRHYNYGRFIKTRKEPDVWVEKKDFFNWINSWFAETAGSEEPLPAIPDKLAEASRHLLNLSDSEQEKLAALQKNLGYRTGWMVFETKFLLKSSASTLEGSFLTLSNILGKRLAWVLINRNRGLLQARPLTIQAAHDALVKIHGEDKAKEIGVQNPKVYTSASIQAAHDALVKIHGEGKAKEIGVQNPQVYTSASIQAAHDALVKIHGEDKAKEIGVQNPKVYTLDLR